LPAKSFASSNPADEQIYLEEVWTLDEKGGFVNKVERSRGVIVMQSEISSCRAFEYNSISEEGDGDADK